MLAEVTTTPVPVEVMLTPAVATDALASSVAATCSNVLWLGMELELGWESETGQGSVLTRDARSAGKGEVASAEAMEATAALASAPTPVRGHKPELAIEPRAVSSTMDQGSALVRDAKSVGSGRKVLVGAM